jgi:16S rRNA processing protein RimM
MTGERRVLLGKIVGVFGVKGWVKIQSHTEPREALFDYRPWLLRQRGNEREIRKVEGRPQGRGLVALLPGVDTREMAETLIGTEIWVDRAALPKPGQGEYYWIDLEGLAVATVDGVELGRVSHLFATGANDVLVVRDGERERLLPFLPGDVVKQVDLEGGRITVDWDPEF